MKKAYSLILTLFLVSFSLVVCSGKSSSSQLTMSPVKAKPGDTVTFSYIPADKNLPTVDSFSLYIYSYSQDLPQVQVIELKKTNKEWAGTYKIPQGTYGLVAKVKLDRESEDNNQGQGFIFALYTPDGKVIPGHKAGLALAYTSWGQLVGLEQDLTRALRLTEEDFVANPEIKKYFANSYLRLLQATKTEGWEEKSRTFLDEISTVPDLDDSTLFTLYIFYLQTGNQEKALAILEQAQKNPKGEFFQMQSVMQFQSIQDSNQQIEFLKKFQAEYPESKYFESIIGMITQNLFQENKLEEANSFLEENRLKTQPHYFYAIANQASQTEGRADLVIKAVDNGLSLLDEQIKAPEKYKPNYYSEEEWNQEMETGLRSMLLRLKGNALLKQGQAAEATSYLKQAYEINQGEQPAIGVDYARVLLANNNFQVAQEVLEAIAGKGFTNSELMNLLKQAYTGSSGSEAGWEDYKNRIEARATEFLRSQLEKQMVEQPAAAFELKDLEGKTVKLANYKGNVVILDFWATWCGPCLSSFPGMKSLVEEFQSDPSVAFIFVNTWQEEENKVQVVKDFLEKNQYPFYVLIDSEDKVVADYGVSGIPTKFIIDPKGKIRFKSIGFEGDTDKMVKEIKLMIELARSK